MKKNSRINIITKIPKAIVFLLLIFVCINHSLYCQNKKPQKAYDSVFIKKGTEIKIGDSIIIFNSDTLICLPDSVIRKNPQLKSSMFYNRLQQKANKRKFTRELYNLAFIKPETKPGSDSIQFEKGQDRYTSFSGKIIRNIRIQKLDVFGPTVYDTLRTSDSKFIRLLNSMNPKTKNFVIKNNLLFKSGQEVEPLVISNSERILRNLPFIYNARILITDITPGSDSVDVLIITKDVFPLGLSFSAKGIDEYDFSIWDVNFLGLGHMFDNTITFQPDGGRLIRYSRGQYKMENIAGTFIQGEVLYENFSESTKKMIKFHREYIPLRSIWIGGTGIQKKTYRDIFPDYDTTYEYDVGLNQQEIFLGQSFYLNRKYSENISPQYFVPQIRFSRMDFFKRPFVSADSNQLYQNRLLLLSSISFFRNNYYESNYILQMGKIEDLPYGMKLTITGGYEFGEFYDRTYCGLDISGANHIDKIGYLYAAASLGSFIRSNSFDQGEIKMNMQYFTKLFTTKKKFRFRHYAGVTYNIMTNSFYYDRMHFNDELGFHGLKKDSIFGSQRLQFFFSTIAFTPWYFYGFRFALEGSINIGLIGSNKEPLLKNTMYSGIVFGIRIKNENLVFETLKISIAYYPIVPDGASHFGFWATGIPDDFFDTFEPTPPEILMYEKR